jgi:hypothetical protein
MNGAIPVLPLYTFMAWTATNMPFLISWRIRFSTYGFTINACRIAVQNLEGRLDLEDRYR